MKKTLLRFSTILLCAVVICLNITTAVWAKIPSPTRYFYVYDEANVLSLTTEDHIITVNESLYAKCGAQIVIACVKTTGTAEIADYAYKLFNKWEIGDKEKKNGVLVVMAIDDGDYYALQGKGLENLLSSGTLKLLLDQYLEPHFSVGDYDAGAGAIFDELVTFLSEIYSLSIGQQTTEQSETFPSQSIVPFGDDEDVEDDDWAIDLIQDGFGAIGSIGSAIGNAISEFPLFEIVSGFFKHLSLSRIILIIVVILLLRSLIGKRRHGGGGFSRGGGGGR